MEKQKGGKICNKIIRFIRIVYCLFIIIIFIINVFSFFSFLICGVRNAHSMYIYGENHWLKRYCYFIESFFFYFFFLIILTLSVLFICRPSEPIMIIAHRMLDNINGNKYTVCTGDHSGPRYYLHFG